MAILIYIDLKYTFSKKGGYFKSILLIDRIILQICILYFLISD